MTRLLLLLALGGCAQSVAETGAMADDPQCHADKAQSFLDKAASADLADAARKAADAQIVRWLRPGMAVTMEYRVGRLNITIDEKNIVTQISCG